MIGFRPSLMGSVFVALLLSSTGAQAAGFYIQEQSVSGLGSAFSGSVSNLNDATTVYYNPAGMTKLKGTQAQAGVHLLMPEATLKDAGSTAPITGFQINGGDGGNPYDPTPVPNGYLSHQVNDDVWIGVSVTAPFGLANEYDRDWFGRYDSIKTELTVIDVQPSIAYKINEQFSIGGGLNIQSARSELTNAVFAGVSEGVSTLEGNDHSVGYTVGMQWDPTESTTIGASYHSGVGHELEGNASAVGTTIADFGVNAEANLDLPDIAMIGIAQDITKRLTVQGQVTWFQWSNFQEIRTVTKDPLDLAVVSVHKDPGNLLSNVEQNYEDTWAFAIGMEYMLNEEWMLRAGFQYDETPTTDAYRTSRTPDGDRTWLSGGATYEINDKISIDFAGTYIWIEDGSIDVDRNNAFSTAVQTDVKAETAGHVGIVALGLNYKF